MQYSHLHLVTSNKLSNVLRGSLAVPCRALALTVEAMPPSLSRSFTPFENLEIATPTRAGSLQRAVGVDTEKRLQGTGQKGDPFWFGRGLTTGAWGFPWRFFCGGVSTTA